jgi:hypothetical protein
MGNPSASGNSGFTVDLQVFEELRSLYSGVVENVNSTCGLISDNGTNDTGSEQLAAVLQQLMRNVGEFLAETSTNVTLDRDGLATARDNYQSSDGRVSQQSRGLLDLLPFRVPFGGLPFGGLPFGGSPGVPPPLVPRPRVSGPADRINTPTGGGR